MHSRDLETSIIHFNSDMSGNVIIYSKVENRSVKISGQDLLDFTVNFLKESKASEILDMSSSEFLKKYL